MMINPNSEMGMSSDDDFSSPNNISREQEKEESSGDNSVVAFQDNKETKSRFLEFFECDIDKRQENHWLSLATPGSKNKSAEPLDTGKIMIFSTIIDLGSPKNKKQQNLKRPSSDENMDNMKKPKISATTGENQESQDTNNFPPSRRVEGGWQEIAAAMGLTPGELCVSKTVTKSDSEPNLNRLQLSQSDINKSRNPLKDLAQQVLESERGIFVNVLDAKGNEYKMAFKYLEISKTYRFMGRDYSNLLASSELKEKQRMEIWGLNKISKENDAEIWLGFINSDGDERTM